MSSPPAMHGRYTLPTAGRGFNPHAFVSAFMVSPAAAGLDATFDSHQWIGESALVDEVVRSAKLAPDAKAGVVDAEALFWAGYLYRYWHFYTGEASAQIYSHAPLEVMLDVYPGMHGLSPDMTVDNLMTMSNGCHNGHKVEQELMPTGFRVDIRQQLLDFVQQRREMLKILAGIDPAGCATELRQECAVAEDVLRRPDQRFEVLNARISGFVERCVRAGLRLNGSWMFYLVDVSADRLTLRSERANISIIVELGDGVGSAWSLSATELLGATKKAYLLVGNKFWVDGKELPL